MGASVNVTNTAITRSMASTLSQSCESSSAVVNVIENIKIKLSGNASCGAIKFINVATASSVCDMTMAADVLASFQDDISSEATAGLGLSVNATDTRKSEDIKQEMETKCGSAALIENSMRGIDIEVSGNAQCDSIEFMNQADATSSCVMKMVSDMQGQSSTSVSAKAAGFDPTTMMLLAFLPCILVCLCCVFCISKVIGGGVGEE